MFTFHMLVGTNGLATKRYHDTRENITFSKHLKTENYEAVVTGIVPRGDIYREKGDTA